MGNSQGRQWVGTESELRELRELRELGPQEHELIAPHQEEIKSSLEENFTHLINLNYGQVKYQEQKEPRTYTKINLFAEE